MSSICFGSACLNCHKKHYEKIANCIVCHRGINKTSRKDIAHFGLITKKFSDFTINNRDINMGREIVNNSHCRRCHYIENKGNFIAVNLNNSGYENIGEYLFKMIKNPVEFMPNFEFDNETVYKIVKYILFNSNNVSIKQNPYPVFMKSSQKSVFKELCSGCHNIISKKTGPVAGKNIGPNLSGLFSGFYPVDFIKPKSPKWDNETLKKWILNPRNYKKNSTMPPLEISKSDLEKLLKEIK